MEARPKSGGGGGGEGKEGETSQPISRNRRSIAEREAASASAAVGFDFDASRNKRPRFRCSAPASLSLDISPGITSSALLDSPIMLSNTQALISPTTGTFQARPLIHETSADSVAPIADGNLANNLSSSCRSNLHANPVPFPPSSTVKDQVFPPSDLAQSSRPGVPYQTSALTHLPMDFEYTTEFSREPSSRSSVCDSATDVKVPSTMISDVPCDRMSQHKEHIQIENAGMGHIREEQKATNPHMGAGRTSEDGYNWRKYGQKQVKGSEHSRSYYKCTHPNCQMKKKVEQSLDGQVTEIIYKGCHNHPKPQPSRRSAVGASFSFNEMSRLGDGLASNIGVEDGSIWRNIQSESKNNRAGSSWRANILRGISSSAVNELSNPLSNTQRTSLGMSNSSGIPDLSSRNGSQDYGEHGATPGSIPFEDDVDDEDSESKKRAIREPRVVVQVESEFDLLDDGYRWRKYGQKVVKGNLNPRSYYKCTSNGCLVRRHVERASNDPKSVITTYEGKHNHEVPAARKSSHGSSSGGNLGSGASGAGAGAGAQSALALHRNANVTRAEALLFGPHFDMKPELSNEYMRPTSMLGNIADEMKFGASSHYSMQFPTLQHSNHYVPFGLDSGSSNAESYQPASMAANFPAGRTMGANGNLMGQFEPYFMGQQLQENEFRLLHPKEELKDDIGTGDANASSSSKIYHPTMGKFPP